MPSVIYVAIGLPGFIRCPVDANPAVSLVKWKKDGLPLRIDKVSLDCFSLVLVCTNQFIVSAPALPPFFLNYEQRVACILAWRVIWT